MDEEKKGGPIDAKQPADEQEPPRYRLTDRAYIDDRMYEEGEEITTRLRPGKHMVPLNASAKAVYDANRHLIEADPLNALMMAPSSFELKPHHMAALEALAMTLGVHPNAPKPAADARTPAPWEKPKG